MDFDGLAGMSWELQDCAGRGEIGRDVIRLLPGMGCAGRALIGARAACTRTCGGGAIAAPGTSG